MPRCPHLTTLFPSEQLPGLAGLRHLGTRVVGFADANIVVRTHLPRAMRFAMCRFFTCYLITRAPRNFYVELVDAGSFPVGDNDARGWTTANALQNAL